MRDSAVDSCLELGDHIPIRSLPYFKSQALVEYTVDSCHLTASAMTQALHSRARTTHLIREEIRNSTLPPTGACRAL